MTDPRPAEVPDREVLDRIIAAWTGWAPDEIEAEDDRSEARRAARAVYEAVVRPLLPSPPAPGVEDGLRARDTDRHDHRLPGNCGPGCPEWNRTQRPTLTEREADRGLRGEVERQAARTLHWMNAYNRMVEAARELPAATEETHDA